MMTTVLKRMHELFKIPQNAAEDISGKKGIKVAASDRKGKPESQYESAKSGFGFELSCLIEEKSALNFLNGQKR
jgi:hypothetical protein